MRIVIACVLSARRYLPCRVEVTQIVFIYTYTYIYTYIYIKRSQLQRRARVASRDRWNMTYGAGLRKRRRTNR